MAYKPNIRRRVGFYQRASQRGDNKTIYLFKSVKQLPAKEKLYSVAYNLSSAAAFVPFSTGSLLAAPYFIGEAWNTISAINKGARGDMKSLFGRGKFLTGASTLNKYGSKAFDAITPSTGVGFIDRYANIAVGQQKAAFLSNVRNMGAKEKLEVISELVANGTILDSELLQQAAGKKAPGKNLGVKTGIFRKWQIQTYYNAFKNAPDPWKNSPFKSAREAKRAGTVRSKRKFHNSVKNFQNPDVVHHAHLRQLMSQVDDMQSDVVYYQGITRYLAADAMLLTKNQGKANPYEALRQKQERDMRKEYREVMGMEYFGNKVFVNDVFTKADGQANLKSHKIYDSGMSVDDGIKKHGLDVDDGGFISTSSSRNAMQQSTDKFIASGLFMSDKELTKEGTITTAAGGKKIDKDGDYFSNMASTIKTNPEVARIFNDFAASSGVSMKAGSTMNEVIGDLMTIFHMVQGDASARNQEFKLRQLQMNVGIMASRLHRSGYSQMGDKFIDLFGGDNAYSSSGKGDELFKVKSGEQAFASVDRNIISAKADTIALITAMNSHAFYQKFRSSLLEDGMEGEWTEYPKTAGTFRSSQKKINLNSLTQNEREALVKSFVADYNFDWEKPESQIGSKIDNPFRGKGSKIDIWQGYADKDREQLLPRDTFSTRARSKKQLQKELIDLVERGAPPAALVDYAKRHYARNSLEELRTMAKKQKLNTVNQKAELLVQDELLLDDYEKPYNKIGGNVSQSFRKSDNFLPTQRQIQEAIHMLDMEKKGKSENDKSEFLFRYIVEFGTANAGDNHANAIRDALEIEFGGPATDRHKRTTNRTDGYRYIPSYFMQLSATTAAARLGIFDKGAQVMSTAPEMGIKQLSKVTIGNKSVGAFNNLRKTYKQKEADLYQGHRRVQQLFKDMDKAVKGSGRTNWNKDSVGGQAMRISHQRNLKLFNSGGGFGDIIHDDIITTAREHDYLAKGIFGGSGAKAQLFDINKLGYRSRTGMNVPMLDTESGQYLLKLVTPNKGGAGAHHRKFKNPKNNILYNRATGGFERNTVGIGAHRISRAMQDTADKSVKNLTHINYQDSPAAYSAGILGIQKDAKMDIQVGRNRSKRWAAAAVLIDNALGNVAKGANTRPMNDIFLDPVLGMGEFFGAIDKNGLSTSWGDKFGKMISTNKGHGLVQKFNRVFLGNEFYNVMIYQMYNQGMNRTILKELHSVNPGLHTMYENLVKKKVGAVVRRLQNQIGGMLNWSTADAFFATEANFRVMLMELATRINSAKMNFAGEMDLLRDYIFYGVTTKSVLKEKGAIHARLIREEMGAEALDSRVHSSTYKDMRDLEFMDDAVLTHTSDDGNPLVLVLATGERMDLEDFTASKGEKFTKLRKVYTKQYNVDPYTGEKRKGGPKYNIHGGWISDNSREDMLKLLGVESMDEIAFEPPTGLGVKEAISVKNSRAARGVEMNEGSDFSFEEVMKAQKTPQEEYIREGKKNPYAWAEDEELIEYATQLDDIQNNMQDVIANIESITNSGADRAHMMGALLEHYHLLLRQGTAKNIAQEKVRGGVIVVSKYFDKAKHNDFTYQQVQKFQMNQSTIHRAMLNIADDIMAGDSVGTIASNYVYHTNRPLMFTTHSYAAGSFTQGTASKTLLAMSMHFKDKDMRMNFFRYTYTDYMKKGKSMKNPDGTYYKTIQNMYQSIGPPTLDYERMGNWTIADWHRFNDHVSTVVAGGGLTSAALTFSWLGSGIPSMFDKKGKRVLDLSSYLAEPHFEDAQYVMRKYEAKKSNQFLRMYDGGNLVKIEWIKNKKMFKLRFNKRKRN